MKLLFLSVSISAFKSLTLRLRVNIYSWWAEKVYFFINNSISVCSLFALSFSCFICSFYLIKWSILVFWTPKSWRDFYFYCFSLSSSSLISWSFFNKISTWPTYYVLTFFNRISSSLSFLISSSFSSELNLLLVWISSFKFFIFCWKLFSSYSFWAISEAIISFLFLSSSNLLWFSSISACILELLDSS